MDIEGSALAQTAATTAEYIERHPPYNKIRVFISSSMRDENGFSWTSFRKELFSVIDHSDLFDPFAIENHASFESSSSLFLSRVEQCDVLVSVIGEELRPGTEQEIRYAIDLKKPLMLITIGKSEDASLQELLHFIHGIDYCTTASVDSANSLPKYIISQLNETVVNLFENWVFEKQTGKLSGVGVHDTTNYSIPREAISAFGDSVTQLVRRLGYSSDWIANNSENPYLEPLGSAIVSWILEGAPFQFERFIPTVKLAMLQSGINETTLDLRLKALNAFIQGDCTEAFRYARLARESIANEESWLLGNCLIDERNLSQYVPNEGFATRFAIQKQINELKIPTVFPLAAKYESSAFEQTLNTARKYRTLNPNATIYDSTIVGVLIDLCSLAFVSALYGSVASVNYSRILIARALLDYSEVYANHQMAFEGMRLLVLAGEADEFVSHCDANHDAISYTLKDEADSLWHLSERGINTGVASIRCALVKKVAPFFSNEVFIDVENYLTCDTTVFDRCRKAWIEALNAIKLRMDPLKLAAVLCKIVSERLYVTAGIVGQIIIGSRLSDLPRESLICFAEAIKDNSESLIEDNLSFAAFAAVEIEAGMPILNEDQLDSASEINRSLYNDIIGGSEKTEIACIEELSKQFFTNNTRGRYAGFFYRPADTICDALNRSDHGAVVEKLARALDSILETLPSYEGFTKALDGPMKVLCRYSCTLHADGLALSEHQKECIGKITETLDSASGSMHFDDYDFGTWRTRVRAVRAASGIDDSLEYITQGLSFGDLSYHAQIAYAESFEWFLTSGIIDDSYKTIATRLAEALARASEAQVRKIAARSLAGCSKRWGLQDIDNTIFALTRDPSDSVTYEILQLCKKGAFGDREFEERIVELLSEDPNWFIRWHIANDE